MTVSSQTPINRSTGNGVTTVFPYGFKIISEADIEVTVDGVAKTLNVDYTVSGVGNEAGGNVAMTAAPANLASVVRRRNMALVRTTDYQDQGEMPAETLDNDFDAAVLMIQQVDEQIGRALILPPGMVGISAELPIPQPLKVLAWNAGATELVNVDIVEGAIESLLVADLASSSGSTLIGFVQSGSGAAASTVQTELRRTLAPEQFGAVGDGATDDTVALQNCINQAQTSGIPILLAKKYLVNQNGVSGYCLLITSRVNMSGPGWIFPSASVPTTCDIIKIQSASAGACDYLSFDGFTIGNSGVGRYPIFVNTSVGSNFGYARITNLTIQPSNSGYAFLHTNNVAGATGGLYLSRLSGNKFFGTVSFTLSGSDNIIEHNEITGSVNGCSIYYSQIAGGVNLWIRNNNCADNGGAILIDSCNSPVIWGNSVELDGTQSGSSGACINLNGGTATITGAIVGQNTIGNLSSSASLPVSLRIANATGTVVEPNYWYTTNATQQASGAWILTTSAASNTWIDKQTYGTPAASAVLSDAGTATSMEGGAWRTYTPTIAVPSGTITTGTVSASYERVGKTLRLRISVGVTATTGAPAYLTATLPAGMSASAVQSVAFANNSLASGASYVSTNQVLMTTAAGSIPNTAATYYASGEIQLT